MNQEQLNRVQNGKGFIAALDQSGGSTPKALLQYGVTEDSYANEEEMYVQVHEMRTRIIKSPIFHSDYILGAILFENTMDRMIDGQYTADYLWEQKGIVPFLKVDKGLAAEENGVQLMKDMPDLDDLLQRAVAKNVFGTKMRSVIKEANVEGIKQVVEQQFAVGKQILAAGLVPIIEPEVDIHSADKEAIEELLKAEMAKQIAALDPDARIMLKLSIPTVDNLYRDLMDDPRVIRIVALSGGYPQKEANERLARNNGLIASFSRGLSEGLKKQQTEQQFNMILAHSVRHIFEASIT